ncbi:MAG: mechanosensitive ion channel family protein [Gammaproteobacteria bacterium]|nr:mechanosensitive ion channel [Rhodocyclaceae bacterium]MBU3910663.1 mechanosensitive ion channel family protein [Gammaproteobacteria bacterium]MBU3989906.1 mechanosensitive ion channel family protein [Gammaproteobacteria bacterium]MBU4005125.1 mechanosensitive ion channel family protein [Gammaproteobacteria bacterium]MBU4021017.1 mechanosensitive ion channel family protein [Gammaproteobacteria bacterium]
MENIFDLAVSLIPLLATALGVFVFLFVANWLLLGRYPELGNERRLPRQLAMLGFTVAGAVAIAISLPVGDSTRNQVIALLGVLLSGVVAFSSTTVISNLMAGLMLQVAKPFRTGDFIRVGEHFGRVAERGLFEVEIQTEQRELVYLSNISSVRLKREQIQLVAGAVLFKNVVAACKGLLDGHLLEQGERKDL